MFTLYIVSTPIGNLQDITLRALETLKRVSVVYCEDTRVTRKLLARYEIATPVKSYHQHSGGRVMREIGESLKKGDVALVTDAGTPGVADPGNELIDALLRHCEPSRFAQDRLREAIPRGSPRSLALPRDDNKITIVPIPGASAATAAASICGFNMSTFTFLGFVPKKKGRAKFFQRVAESDIPVILYEAPYRIVKTLEELGNALSSSRVEQSGTEGSLSASLSTRAQAEGSRQALHSLRSVGMTETTRIVVCRELTKKFESIYRGTVEEALDRVQGDPIKGEYVIVVEGRE